MTKIAGIGSGTSTAYPFSMGVAHELATLGVYPDVFNGCSGTSSIFAFWAADAFRPEVIDEAINFKSDTVFNKNPVNSKGGVSLRGLWRAITLKPSLGEQENFRKVLMKHFTDKDINAIGESHRRVFATLCSYNRKRSVYVDIGTKGNMLSRAYQYIMGSSAIPLAVMPEKIVGFEGRDEYCYDGGVLEHNGGKQLARRNDIDVIISIWSRTNDLPKIRRLEHLESKGLTHTKEYYELSDWEEWKPKNVVNVDFRTHDVRTYGVSIEDEEHIDLLCEKNDIQQIKIFPDYKLKENTYEFDIENNRKMYEHGREKAREAYNKYKSLLDRSNKH